MAQGRWRRWLKRLVFVGAGLLVLGFGGFLVAYFRSTNECDQPRAAPANPVKAATYCEYGTPDVIRVEAVEKPVPGDEQILVKVRATAVNPYDWHFLRGTPYLVRLQTGLRKPASTRLGVDFAGTVEAVGKSVTKFKVGDEVFGGGRGAFAEYMTVGQDRAVVLKPAGVTFEQAAAIPIAGVTALQALRDRASIGAGTKVLVNGASGGVGTFAVQIAKTLGADVTGVCSTRNLDLVRSLGAGHVVDYTKEDFTKGAERYDVIMDNVGNLGALAARRVLTPKGKLVLIGGGGPDAGNWIGPLTGLIEAKVVSKFVDQQMGMFMANLTKDDLAMLADLIQSGRVTPVIDRKYSLDQIAEAVRYVEAGHARGKVIVIP